MPEHRSADRSSICAHAWQSLGTCPVALLGDGGRSVGARCNVCCRMRHRQLGGQGQHCGRQSSCAVSDRRRWTGWRSPRSRRFGLLVRILPLRTKVRRGFPRRGLYQEGDVDDWGREREVSSRPPPPQHFLYFRSHRRESFVSVWSPHLDSP
jgi:hypothetical protein